MNRAQVNRGWATVHVSDNNPFERVDAFPKAQRRAKAAPRCIWRLSL